MSPADQKMVEFCDALELQVQAQDASMEVKLGRAFKDSYLVTIQNATHKECYTVDLTTGEWMIIYGT